MWSSSLERRLSVVEEARRCGLCVRPIRTPPCKSSGTPLSRDAISVADLSIRPPVNR